MSTGAWSLDFETLQNDKNRKVHMLLYCVCTGPTGWQDLRSQAPVILEMTKYPWELYPQSPPFPIQKKNKEKPPPCFKFMCRVVKSTDS